MAYLALFLFASIFNMISADITAFTKKAVSPNVYKGNQLLISSSVLPNSINNIFETTWQSFQADLTTAKRTLEVGYSHSLSDILILSLSTHILRLFKLDSSITYHQRFSFFETSTSVSTFVDINSYRTASIQTPLPNKIGAAFDSSLIFYYYKEFNFYLTPLIVLAYEIGSKNEFIFACSLGAGLACEFDKINLKLEVFRDIYENVLVSDWNVNIKIGVKI